MPNLIWDLSWRDRGVKRGLTGIADAQDKAERKAQAYRQVAGVAFVALGAAAIRFGKDSVRAYGEAQAAQGKLSDAFSRFPRLADTNQTALQRLNTVRQKSTRFDDDATAAAQAQLAQYKLTGAQLTELTPLLQDYAAKTGKDLPQAAKDLGLATLGQGRALKSVGLNLKDTGTLTGNYEQLVKGLRTQVGGFAEKEGKTAAGQLAILGNQFGELQESAGKNLAPAVGVVVEGLTDLVEVVGENSDVIVPLAAGIGGLTTAIWLGHKAAKAYAVMHGLMGTAMASNSRVATSLASVVGKAGPWGLAIAGGATLLGVFAGQQAAAERETKAFTDQLTYQKGALDANSRQMLANKLATEGTLEAAKRAGVAEADYVRALVQGGSARDRMITQLNDTGVAARANVDAFQGDVVAQEDLANAAFEAADKLKLMGGGLDTSKRAAELAETAFKGSTDATDDQAAAAKTAKLRLAELAATMFNASEAALALSGSEISFEQAVDDATAAVKQNGKTLDLNTQKGRDNKTALNNLVTSSQGYISKLVETGRSSKDVQRATQNARDEFIRVARRMGESRDRAKELADRYFKIPKNVKTAVSAPGMSATDKAARTLRDRILRLPDKDVQINFKSNASTLAFNYGIAITRSTARRLADQGRNRNLATGGVLPGFTPGRDVHRFVSATGGVLNLSGGEAVMRPEWTRAVGGAAAVKRMNEEARAHSFADGGVYRSIRIGSGPWPGHPNFGMLGDRIGRELGGRIASRIDARLESLAASGGGGPIGGGSYAGALRWARAQDPKPYIWAGVGPRGYDCSGFMGAIANFIQGRSLHTRRFSTGQAGGRTLGGFTRGKNSPFRIGVVRGNPGHTAGTLNGVNVESRGGEGVVIGPRARGANNRLFTMHYGLARGGVIGDPAFDRLDPRGRHYLPWLRDLQHGLASGGVVKGGRGGVATRVGEGRFDELVTPLPRNWQARAAAGGHDVVELGPRSIAAIASALTVEIDGKQVARAVRYQGLRGTT